MKCDKCVKKATVHLTEIIDGNASEMHLCEDCAREQSQHMEQQFGLADLLAGLTDFGKHVPEVAKVTLACSACGLVYEDFRKFGRFGCAQCYETFKPHLKALLKKIHGSNVHLGKKLDGFTISQAVAAQVVLPSDEVGPKESLDAPVHEVDQLRLQMHQAIEKEDFESAASLRDQIRELEQKG